MSGAERTQHVLDALRKYWGFEALRPLQAEAIDAGLARRDSLVVMPTGGGKSLCYQIPPLLANRCDVVVSPLISLMKDQVDGLRACGYPAAALYSGMARGAESQIAAELHGGRLRLLFVSPERLLTQGFLRLLQPAGVQAFAIDEAHCISHWGHDFRPEYRRLAELKRHFPGAALHAFTATATERVRDDIVRQLRLRDPAVLVGQFDRPNLVYRVVPRTDVGEQTLGVLRRHEKQAAIVYCITRRDTEALAYVLQQAGLRAAHYHAGMDAGGRQRTQDAFAREQIDVIVATVAFGMGIDRSDVRCVIHAAMPKSVEHYQQETGRAGRDGLEAECVLLYSPADAFRWEGLVYRSAEDAEVDPAVTTAMLELLGHVQAYASGLECRHAALVRYFGQRYERENCGACDVCLGEIEEVEDATILAQKVLSCVARVQERFGAGHVVDVLRGANTERVRQLGHDRLSTYGLLKDMDMAVIKRRVYDLLDQGLLTRSGGEMPVLRLNAASWEVMRGQRRVMLRRVEERAVRDTRVETDSWEGVDRGLYAALRELRQALANERGAPVFTIFADVTMRDIARRRPASVERFRDVHGIGQAKAAEFGPRVTALVRQYCTGHGLATNQTPAGGGAPRAAKAKGLPSLAKRRAFQMFADGAEIEEVMEALERARSTTMSYLAEFIAANPPETLDRWVDRETYERVRRAHQQHDTQFLRPVFEALDGQVPYEVIRLVVAHLSALAQRTERGIAAAGPLTAGAGTPGAARRGGGSARGGLPR